jgi:SNF2 family DNA or RNA helicase
MKTEGMAHQLDYLEQAKGRKYFANLSEQGTGKTWCTLAEIERLWEEGEIELVIIIAPKGVHTNWVRREMPKHLSIDIRQAVFKAGLKTPIKELNALWKAPRDKLKIATFNIDSVKLKAAWGLLWNLANDHKTMIVIDESSRIKTPTSGRTKQVLKLTMLADYRRILTGTPVTNSPSDVFSQFEFLRPGLLGTRSYRAFVAEYTQLMSQDSDLVRDILDKMPPGRRQYANVQIPVRGSNGRPVYRNLERLRDLVAPHSFRVLKKDCLDLPDKIYKTHYFELTPAQRRIYDRMLTEFQYILADEEVEVFQRIAVYTKLQQITSGFVMIDGEPIELDEDGEPIHMIEDNPRMEALFNLLEDIEGKVIIWALYHAEIDMIVKGLVQRGEEVVQYHGRVSDKLREEAIDSFQEGSARFFVGNAAAGGIGITLTAAETAIYYSNSFNWEHRAQSEDRNHRFGTTKALYIDLVAENSRDEEVADALQQKDDTARKILGDPPREIRT